MDFSSKTHHDQLDRPRLNKTSQDQLIHTPSVDNHSVLPGSEVAICKRHSIITNSRIKPQLRLLLFSKSGNEHLPACTGSSRNPSWCAYSRITPQHVLDRSSDELSTRQLRQDQWSGMIAAGVVDRAPCMRLLWRCMSESSVKLRRCCRLNCGRISHDTHRAITEPMNFNQTPIVFGSITGWDVCANSVRNSTWLFICECRPAKEASGVNDASSRTPRAHATFSPGSRSGVSPQKEKSENNFSIHFHFLSIFLELVFLHFFELTKKMFFSLLFCQVA